MPAPTIREVVSGSVLYTAPSDTVTVTTGVGTAVDDWLLAVYEVDYGLAGQVSAPSAAQGAWELLGSSSRASNPSHLKAWARKVTTAGAQTISVTHTDEYADAALAVLVLTGVNHDDVLSAFVAGSGSHATSHVAPTMTPLDATELLVCAWASGPNQNDSGNYAAPTGMTLRAEVDCTPYSTLAVATQALTSNAATGTKAATFTRSASPTTATGYASFSLGIRCAPASADEAFASPLSIASDWVVSRETTVSYDSPLTLDSATGRSKEASVVTESPLVLSDSYAPVKDVAALPAGGPINLSVYAVTDTGYVPLPDCTRLDLSPVVNDAGSVSLDYPEWGLNFSVLHEMITDDRDLEIAIWVGGRDEGSLRALLTDASGDEVDEQAIWSFSGAFLESRLTEAIIWPAELIIITDTVVEFDPETNQPRVDPETGEQVTTTTTTTLNPNFETIFENATAGEVLAELMEAAHGRGALADIDATSFGAISGSNGVRFTKTATMKLSPGTTYKALLDSLVEIGLCEWEVTADHRLRLYEPDTRGRDRTTDYPPVVLRAGKDLTDSPRTFSTRDTATFLLLAGKEGLRADINDSIAQTRRGRRIESYRGVGNIADLGTLQAFGQADLASRATGSMELSHGLTFAEGGPVPIADFDRYDWVWSDQGWGLERLRVAQWNISQDADGNLSGSAQLNDLTSDWEARTAKRLAAIERQEIIIGTPAEPPPPANNYRHPAAPTGLVASSLNYQDLGPPVANYASVIAGWADVVLNADGSALTVSPYYRLRYRYLDGPGAGEAQQQWPGGPNGWQKDLGDTDEWIAAVETAPAATSGSFSGLNAGRSIEVQVATVIPLDPPGPYEVDERNRSFRRTILQSSWSAGFTLTTDQDAVAPPPPSTPDITEYLGTIKTAWDGFDEAGLPMPPDFARTEVHVSTVSNFTPDEATLRDTLFGAGHTMLSGLLYGVTYFVRLVAVDLAGNRSEPSAQGAAITRELLGEDIFAGAVGEAQLAYAAVTTAKIRDLAVNDAKIANLSVGKLTAGIMTAELLLAGRIKTAETGARIEFDGISFRQYNMSGQLRTQFLAADGSALITGTIRSAESGQRWEMHPDGTLRLYASTGQGYNAIFNLGSEVVFRGQLGSGSKSGYLRISSLGTSIQFGVPDTGAIEANLAVGAKNIDMTSPVNGLRSDHRFATADGTVHRNVLIHTDGSGNDDPDTVIEHYGYSNGAGLHAPGNNCGWFFTDSSNPDGISAEHNDGNPAHIYCSGITQSSGVDGKDAIEEIPPGQGLTVVRGARSRKWKVKHEMSRPPKPGHRVRRIVRRDEHGTPVEFEYVDAEWKTPAPTPETAAPRFGPIAEEIGQLVPELVAQLPGPPVAEGSSEPRPGVDLGNMIGVLWQAISELSDKVDELSDKFADVDELPGRGPTAGPEPSTPSRQQPPPLAPPPRIQ